MSRMVPDATRPDLPRVPGRSGYTYDSRPGPYETRPGSYETRPGSYETRPGPYETRPGPYETRPERYDTRPSHGRQRPNMPPGRPPGRPPRRSRGRMRRLRRSRTVRVIGALLAVFIVWLGFSVGSALASPGGGSTSTKLAEWARDHQLGALVTFGEWLTYNPPKSGGKPQFSLTVPSQESVSSLKGQGSKSAKSQHSAFVPDIPAALSSFAGKPLSGEGQWRVVEKVNGEPAMFSTFLRGSATYTSYVNGIVSIDQRLATFQLHPGSEDPGPGNWGEASLIPHGSRTGLLATFNGGFKLNASEGGFYLNGHYHGSLTSGAASIVYYKDGTIKIGQWGRDVWMTSSVTGVRQNLKLVVDHGQVPDTVTQNVESAWGATLGGGYFVWRSGIGITADGRIVYVYGPELDVKTLADLLQRAGAVEAMQLDINPAWTSFEYYTAYNPSNPSPTPLLPTQQGRADRYYTLYSRDFTTVYAR